MNCSDLEELLMKSDCDDSDADNNTSLEDDVSEGMYIINAASRYTFH